MTETTSGLRSILSNPRIYQLVQDLLGARSSRAEIIRRYIRPKSGLRILDIGCGPAELLGELPHEIEYTGFDASERYIERARQRFGERGKFYQKYVSSTSLQHLGNFDLVIAIGILHHLEDGEVLQLSELACNSLDTGGRLLTIDPAIEADQSGIARFLINRDRGQNLRSAQEYRRLLESNQCWNEIRVDIRHDLLRLPYTHAIIECRKAG